MGGLLNYKTIIEERGQVDIKITMSNITVAIGILVHEQIAERTTEIAILKKDSNGVYRV